VVAVNDHFVMNAWAQATGANGKILFLADGNGDFVRAAGLDLDLSAGGLGTRSKRFSMIVEDGKVTALNIEDAPGQAVESGAAKLLEQL
jgi:glutaredoxin/glutathione-dependent peroxiredoxin